MQVFHPYSAWKLVTFTSSRVSKTTIRASWSARWCSRSKFWGNDGKNVIETPTRHTETSLEPLLNKTKIGRMPVFVGQGIPVVVSILMKERSVYLPVNPKPPRQQFAIFCHIELFNFLCEPSERCPMSFLASVHVWCGLERSHVLLAWNNLMLWKATVQQYSYGTTIVDSANQSGTWRDKVVISHFK